MYAHLEITRMRHQQLMTTAAQARHRQAVPRQPRFVRFRRRPTA